MGLGAGISRKTLSPAHYPSERENEDTSWAAGAGMEGGVGARLIAKDDEMG